MSNYILSFFLLILLVSSQQCLKNNDKNRLIQRIIYVVNSLNDIPSKFIENGNEITQTKNIRIIYPTQTIKRTTKRRSQRFGDSNISILKTYQTFYGKKLPRKPGYTKWAAMNNEDSSNMVNHHIVKKVIYKNEASKTGKGGKIIIDKSVIVTKRRKNKPEQYDSQGNIEEYVEYNENEFKDANKSQNNIKQEDDEIEEFKNEYDTKRKPKSQKKKILLTENDLKGTSEQYNGLQSKKKIIHSDNLKKKNIKMRDDTNTDAIIEDEEQINEGNSQINIVEVRNFLNFF